MRGIYKRQGSPYWWAEYQSASGDRVRKSTGVRWDSGPAGRQEAEAILGKWKADAHREKVWGITPSAPTAPAWTVDEVLLRYWEEHGQHLRSGTKRIKSAMRQLYSAWSGRTMESLSSQDIRAYIRARSAEVSAGTINKEIGLMSAAINHCRKEHGWQIGNPCTGQKLREPEGRVRWLSDAEAERLLTAAASMSKAPWLVDIVQTALNTGMRMGELLGLTWSRVDWENGLVLLESEHTKAGKRRSVPLNASAREALQRRQAWHALHCPLSPWVFCRRSGQRLETVRRSFIRACTLAGIEDYRQHDQRHTLASWLVMRGVPLVEVRDVLGHSTIKMTERYAHLAPENLRAAVERVGVGLAHSRHTDEEEKPETDAK